VDDGIVSGWDDPRMPTIAGMRRRGFTPAAIRQFCEMVGTTRANGVVDVAMLEHAIRDDLNQNAPRAMCVLRPLRLILRNLPDGHARSRRRAPEPRGPRHALPAILRRAVHRREDFREEANKKFKRLVLGKRVRLRNAYVIEAVDVEKDAAGEITAVIADVIEGTLGADPADGVKPKGVIHWVEAGSAVRATVRLYDRLFTDPAPDRGGATSWSIPQPGLPAGHRGRAGRALAGAGDAGGALPVRARGLFRRRPLRAHGGASGLQPDHRPARRLGRERILTPWR
jgi:glutaminyl-tRNA synthetase